MDYMQIQQELLEKAKIDDLLPHLNYIENGTNDTTLWELEDDHVGFGFISQPLAGCNDKVVVQLSKFLSSISTTFDPRTIVQFSMFGSPDVSFFIEEFLKTHITDNAFLKEVVHRNAEYYEEASKSHIEETSKTRLRKILLFITIKVPFKRYELDDKSKVEKLKFQANSVRSVLDQIGFVLHDMDRDHMAYVMHTLLNWDDNSTWRMGAVNKYYDESVPSKYNFVDRGNRLARPNKHDLQLGKKHLAVMACKSPRSEGNIGHMIGLITNIFDGSEGIEQNFLMTTNIIIADNESEKAKVNSKMASTNKLAFGEMSKYNRRIGERKKDLDETYDSISKGNRMVKASIACTIFCDSFEEVNTTKSKLQSFWDSSYFRFYSELEYALPTFLNQLPMVAQDIDKDSQRYRPYTTEMAANLLPVVLEWTGGKSPAMLFSTRAGNPFPFDLFESDRSYSCVISAESGSGKSFLTNHIISSYLSQTTPTKFKTHAWAIDIGYSYQQQCTLLGGNYVDFGDENLVMNPFEHVDDYDDSADMLIGILSVMAAPNEGLTDHQNSNLRRIMKRMWAEYGKELTIDLIATALIEEPDHEQADTRRIGRQLFSFTSDGEFGKYFSGKSNIDLHSKQFTVLELKSLKDKQHLQRVVLFMMMYAITSAMKRLPEDVKKIIILDEAWQMLSANADVAKYMENAYRTWRKETGSAIVVTQQISDLYGSPSGEAIAANSPNKLFLGQADEQVELAAKRGQLSLDDFGYNMLKSVKTIKGKFSEIFVMKDKSFNVVKFVAPRFIQLLYTTSGDEKARIKKLMYKGFGLYDAIKEYIELEKSKQIPELDRFEIPLDEMGKMIVPLNDSEENAA